MKTLFLTMALFTDANLFAQHSLEKLWNVGLYNALWAFIIISKN